MCKLLLFTTLLTITNAFAYPRTNLPQIDGRIVGGTPADISEAPYQVALLLESFGSGLYYLACGGSIISESVVITTAHCLDQSKIVEWQIRAGSTFSGSGGQTRSLSKKNNHPNYDSYDLDFDISLLTLSSAFIINGGSVKLVPLPVQDQEVDDGAIAFVTGWGSTEEQGSTESTLWQVNIPIVNQNICKNIYANLLYPVTDRMMCAGNLESGGQSVCSGDFGGPLTINGVLIGITSWGFGCGRPGYPSVWTRIPYFRNWIDSQLI